MGNALANFVQLGVFATAGLFLACKVVPFPITHQRKVIAAVAFALVYSLPLGILVHFLAPVAFWFLLEDPEAESRNRLPVILLTYLFTAILTLLFFYLTH